MTTVATECVYIEVLYYLSIIIEKYLLPTISKSNVPINDPHQSALRDGNGQFHRNP